MSTKKALVIGATGATGRELVNLLLEDSAYYEVHIFVRKAPLINHNKLTVHEVDFNKLEEWKQLLHGEVLFSAMGTTKKDAGSKEVQYKVDYTYQYEVAKAAAKNGVDSLLLVSSVGASAKSPLFYPRIKGELEEAVALLPFKIIHILQPPMLHRQPDKIRSAEKSYIAIINGVNRLGMFKTQRPILVRFLAEKMIKLSHQVTNQKISTYDPKEIHQI